MSEPHDDRAREGLEHLQTAALELIAAARAFLDVAEDLVHDPAKAADLVSAVGEVAEVAGLGRRRRESDGSPGRDDRPERIQRIQVS